MNDTFSEARFTKPRPDCPNPERWTSDDADSTEREVSALVAAYVGALQPDLVLETGTAFGFTAQAIGRALENNGQGRLITLEIAPRRVELAKSVCSGLPVVVLQADSMHYSPPGKLDFLWIDSLFELRDQEIKRYRNWASKRCVIGIHDTGPQHPMQAKLAALVRQKVIREPLYLPTPRGVAFTRYV